MTLHGLLLVDKPRGPSSHDVVAHMRRTSGEARIGHTGTLDPLASGLLVLCLGRATRLSEYLLGHDKRYLAEVQLGQSTTTYDAEGAVTLVRSVLATHTDVAAALQTFIGTIRQAPPAYSAVKVGGQPAYKLARSGRPADPAARPVTIHTIELLTYTSPRATILVHCSAGTYIRSLAHDLGQLLGCGAHLADLKRTAAGPFLLSDAHTLEHLDREFAAGAGATLLQPADAGLQMWPKLELDSAAAARVMHGQTVPAPDAHGVTRAYNPSGSLIAIMEADAAGTHWVPRKVLVPQ
jgi:tRNA pseudouridine55 synthase